MGRNAKRIREKLLREAAEADRPENRDHPDDSLLPQEFVIRLREEGLYILDYPFFVSGHVATPSGYSVLLPAKNGGNRGHSDPAYYYEADGRLAETFMPNLVIWRYGDSWSTEVFQYAPGPGPGDFKHTFTSLDAAFEDIVSYFFDPQNQKFLEWSNG